MSKSITSSNKLNHILSILLLIVCIVLFVFPFLNIIAVSLSSARAIYSGEVFLWPIELDTEAWKKIFENASLIRSLWFTIFMTFAYTVFSMILTICAAYPLSKKNFKGRNVILLLFIFTMYFSGGLIPKYLLVSNLKLLDTFWALILPGMFSVYNMLILKTFFASIPKSLEESARIDGCSDIGIVIKIIFPLSLPAIATLSLFYAVSRWNSFSDALFYVNKAQLQPLQLYLQRLLATFQSSEEVKDINQNVTVVLPESLRAASIIFVSVPIILVFPFLQKYFVKGVMIGSIKG